MNNYFPYSQVINNIRVSYTQSQSRTTYVGDSYVDDREPLAEIVSAPTEISELYY